MFFNKSRKLLEQANALLQKTQENLSEKNLQLENLNDALTKAKRENEELTLRYSSFINKSGAA